MYSLESGHLLFEAKGYCFKSEVESFSKEHFVNTDLSYKEANMTSKMNTKFTYHFKMKGMLTCELLRKRW